MAREIKTTIALDGEAKFKAALQSARKEITVMTSEIGAMTSGYSRNEAGMKRLRAESDNLAKRVEAQKNVQKSLQGAVGDMTDRLEKYKAAYKAATEAQSDNTEEQEKNRKAAALAQQNIERTQKSLDEYTIQLNKATSSLNKMESELESSQKAAKDLKNLKLNDFVPDKVAENIRKAEKEMKKLATAAGKAAAEAAKIGGKTITAAFKASTAALTAYTAAATAAGTAIVKLTADAALFADDINTLSKQTGISTQELQKMTYAADLIDVDVDTISKSMARLTKNMATAQKGTGDAAAAFTALGVSITDDVTGQLRSNDDVFTETLNALAGIENETQRDAYAMQIFGKSAQDLNPLILGGAEQLKALGDSAEAAGLILSQDALDSLNDFNDSVDVMKGNLSASKNVIAGAFAGSFKTVTDKVGAAVPKISNSFAKMFSGKNTEQAEKEFTQQINELAGSIGEDINRMLPAFLNGFNTVVKAFVLQIPEGINTILPPLIDGLVSLADGFAGEIPSVLPTIIDSAVTLFTGLLAGLNKVIDKLIPMLPVIITDVSNTIIDSLPLIIETGFDLLVGLINGITQALPSLIEKAGDMVSIVADTLTENISPLVRAGISMIVTLARSFPKAIPTVLEAVPEIVGALIGAFMEVDWLETSKQIFAGLGDGIVEVFSSGLGIIDNLLGTNLQGWYDETTAFWRGVGDEMYKALHGDEVQMNEMSTKYNSLLSDMNSYTVEMLRQGKTVAEAMTAAEEKYLDTAEKRYYYQNGLADYYNADKVAEWADNIKNSGYSMPGQGYYEEYARAAAVAGSSASQISGGGTTNNSTTKSVTIINQNPTALSPYEQQKQTEQQLVMARLYS